MPEICRSRSKWCLDWRVYTSNAVVLVNYDFSLPSEWIPVQQPLEERFVYLSALIFLVRLINSEINCPRHLAFINFYEPTRSFQFTRTFHPQCYSPKSDPDYRLCSKDNSLPTALDLFANGPNSFRNSLIIV